MMKKKKKLIKQSNFGLPELCERQIKQALEIGFFNKLEFETREYANKQKRRYWIIIWSIEKKMAIKGNGRRELQKLLNWRAGVRLSLYKINIDKVRNGERQILIRKAHFLKNLKERGVKKYREYENRKYGVMSSGDIKSEWKQIINQ
ncbi:unnamed protein product (macronuclear) [Paramecium tetraurelia]|uniref:Uncharacterized protein n=1 Tax=Paramecium tetraurelia TaxID=5888 RepID=A0DE27_PARTE|nr:uncharacterized protein GSPATT00016136001 [Paramecium tetraurelia]CAK81294.1 unnamed protein product [Paramecium tetraurelia]|eukprot:XP_001448691.1 hypothetical protein (macronuclear) [Paramecium tetraurelia strain d4-2]